ncbi:MAG: minor capsid protein [Candidatus Limiplasma sp.]|nr:minor capsid protein [Candidatus Limiplasma sp.]
MQKIIGKYAQRMNLTREEAERFLRAPYDEDSRAYGYRMTRAEALKQAAQEQAKKLADLERREMKAQWDYAAKESARRAGDMLKNMGAGTGFVSPDAGGVTRALNTRWAGKSYSDRIWANTAMLAETLEKEVTAAFLSGKSNAAIAQAITERFGVEFRQAERLVRTETAYVNNQAALDSYRAAGAKEVEFLTARDSKTCTVCAPLNGKVIPIEAAVVGETIGPIHPWCRCGVVLSEAEGERLLGGAEENMLQVATKQGILGPEEAGSTLINERNRGIIDVEIDELTPCLRKLSTGEIVQTTVEQIGSQTTDFSGWFFDWSVEAKNNPAGIYGLFANGDTRLQGIVSIDRHGGKGAEVRLVESAYYHKYDFAEYEGIGGHLFAEAVKQSRESGNEEGFVFFEPKTGLIEYYAKMLGAVQGHRNMMGIYGQASRDLFERYYGRWDEWKPKR